MPLKTSNGLNTPAWRPCRGAVLALSLACPALCGALDWSAFQGHRTAPLEPCPTPGRTGFTTMSPAQTGVTFTNSLADERSLTNQILLNGSGVALGDVNGDGWVDAYFSGLERPGVLYLNRGGWRFEDITAQAGVACAGQASTGAAFADVDGDGDLDLLVNGLGKGTRLFLNDGTGRFREGTRDAGLGGTAGSMSMALADVDGDGDLDLYVVNYRVTTMRDEPEKRFKVGVTNGVYRLLTVDDRPANSPELEGRFVVSQASGALENGEPDQFYTNDGHGHFTAVRWDSGTFLDEAGRPVERPFDWGLSAQFRDLNGDGAPDLYVCNDFQSPDRLWLNDGRGHFRACPRPTLRATSLFSMGMDGADIDRDGRMDFFVADMLSRNLERRLVQVMDAHGVAAADPGGVDRPQLLRNTLFRNRGDGTFAEIGRFAGVEASEWSWCPVFLDVDLDGFEDLLISTGHWRDAQNADVAATIETERRRQRRSFADELRLRQQFPKLLTPNVAFRNRGNLTFEEIGHTWGFDSTRVSHGIALADLDNDGDLDVVTTCLNDGPLLLRNDTDRPRLQVRLKGEAPNGRGIGARIRVSAAGLPDQEQEVLSGGRYLSSDDAVRVFAVTAGKPVRVEVFWRRGGVSVVSNVPAQQILEVAENSKTALPAISTEGPKPFFEDISDRLKHVHTDEPFDDFERQRLLPRRLSQLGPGISCFDFNGDGWADILIGTGRGGRLGVYRNDTHGGFVPQRAGSLQGAAADDLTTVLGWHPAPGEASLLLGTSTYETAPAQGNAVRQFHLMTGADIRLPQLPGASTGPLCLADVDGDGDLDLFVGARSSPGRYPEGPPSQILLNDAGTFRRDPARSQRVAGLGMVSGSVFTDLDGDGTPELVAATDWGSIRILRQLRSGGELWDAPVQYDAGEGSKRPLSALTGAWTSVAAGDFDGDGAMDLALGNWGLNFLDNHLSPGPRTLWYGDLDGDGTSELLESLIDPARQAEVPVRDWRTVGASFDFVREKFHSFTEFSKATVPEILQPAANVVRPLRAEFFESVVLLNRTNFFQLQSLPAEVQLSPVFGMAVADFDGDGNQDLFVTQNFHGTALAENRQDASRSLWMRGDGRGGFLPVAPAESGLVIDGEGRGVAVADLDHDGRPDIVAAQNRGATRVFLNRQGRPSLRLRVQGTAANPAAIGASVQPVFETGRRGPRQEWHGGSGYWSQDAAELLVPLAQNPKALEVRWPGGKTSTHAIEAGKTELLLVQPAP